MRSSILEISAPMISPHLKPEHKQWVDKNMYTPEGEALGHKANEMTQAHPEFRASMDKVDIALDKVSSLSKENSGSPEHLEALDAFKKEDDLNHQIYAKKFAEHLSGLIDNHIATAPQREQQQRIDKATESAKNTPIVKTRNGKYTIGCYKCGGSGVIPRFGNTADGMCFDCKGVGYNPRTAVEHDSAESLRQKLIESGVAQAKDPVIPRNTTASPAVAAPAPSERPKGFTNKFPGNCVGCNTRVGTGEGMTSKGKTGWEVRCVGCHHG
jgi:hypothetical protein